MAPPFVLSSSFQHHQKLQMETIRMAFDSERRGGAQAAPWQKAAIGNASVVYCFPLTAPYHLGELLLDRWREEGAYRACGIYHTHGAGGSENVSPPTSTNARPGLGHLWPSRLSTRLRDQRFRDQSLASRRCISEGKISKCYAAPLKLCMRIFVLNRTRK